MALLCKVCDCEVFENGYENYIATLRKKNNKSNYTKHIINIVNLDELDKRLSDYITTHNKNFFFILLIVNLKYSLTKNSQQI